MEVLEQLATLFGMVLALTVVVEAITENINDLCNQLFKRKPPARLTAVILSVGGAVYLKVDLLTAINGDHTLLGMVLTGLIASRGANYVNDHLSIKKLLKDEAKKEAQGG
ncbi:MAG: hypothetical protein ACRCXK_04520 [Wohlfahrtiimonas sp.]